MTEPISVLIADDHTLVRETLAVWLRTAPDIRIVGEVGSADEAIAEAVKSRPGVVVFDIDMPGLLCFDAARVIRSRLPETRILFLSAFFSDRYIQDALKAEASGYLTKSESPESVVQAIRTVAAGGVYFSPEVQSRIVIDADGVRLGEEPKTRASLLTARELEVLRYIARGLSKKKIAAIMHLSVKTVDNHSASIMNKLDIHDRVSLARFAIREGLAEV
jgi:DNA-binding NarL/FixJ family response regulator